MVRPSQKPVEITVELQRRNGSRSLHATLKDRQTCSMCGSVSQGKNDPAIDMILDLLFYAFCPVFRSCKLLKTGKFAGQVSESATWPGRI
ncbi:hypothetical protein [Thalassoglobus sp.]|uniref:hypothetical protein n=1 Tax=Thalassoglobus sp. TaxID=2795869 RepID=UPI003AA9B576